MLISIQESAAHHSLQLLSVLSWNAGLVMGLTGALVGTSMRWRRAASNSAVLLARAQAAVRRQEVLARLGRRVVENADTIDVVAEAVTTASDVLDAPIVTVFEVVDGCIVELVGHVGWPSDTGARVEFSPDSQAAFIISEAGGFVIVDDYDNENRFTPATLLTSLKIRNTIAARVGPRDAPYGIISVHSTKAHHFDSDSVAFLEELSNLLWSFVRARRHTARLAEQATVDPLTGVRNRRGFAERLDTCSPGSAMLVVDVDHLKMINDTLGHYIGDEVLKSVAARLQDACGERGVVGRLGGDEFAVLLSPDPDGPSPAEVADRVIERIGDPVEIEGRRIDVAVSVGVSDGVDPADLIRTADVALYGAKRAGRGQSVIFSADHHTLLLRSSELRERLAEAIRQEKLTVAYEPIIDISSGRIHSGEALARWTDPKFGSIPPDVFIPLADESGVIGELGSSVLRMACAQLGRLHDSGVTSIRMSVNVSPRQLLDAQLVEHVSDALQQANLPPSALMIEITEGALSGTDAAIERLWEFRSLGVAVAIDDFGSSESSLARMHELPIDVLKLDRGFLVHVDEHPERTARLVDAVVKLAGALDLQTIAEGIETPAQLDLVRRAGVDLGQGHLLGRPMPAREFERLVIYPPTPHVDQDPSAQK